MRVEMMEFCVMSLCSLRYVFSIFFRKRASVIPVVRIYVDGSVCLSVVHEVVDRVSV
jgi:hypothetical protein